MRAGTGARTTSPPKRHARALLAPVSKYRINLSEIHTYYDRSGYGGLLEHLWRHVYTLYLDIRYAQDLNVVGLEVMSWLV